MTVALGCGLCVRNFFSFESKKWPLCWYSCCWYWKDEFGKIVFLPVLISLYIREVHSRFCETEHKITLPQVHFQIHCIKVPAEDFRQFAASREKSVCSFRTVWSEKGTKIFKFCYIRKAIRNIRKHPVDNFRKNCYVTFLSLPCISCNLFLVTEEELDAIHLRHSFPNRIKVLSKLLQRSLNFSVFSVQYTMSQMFDWIIWNKVSSAEIWLETLLRQN